jgi:ABC-type branched-subunit amino acid transport system ATPase component
MKVSILVIESRVTREMLEVQNLTKFFGALKAVDNASFKIPSANERIIGLIGPNGSGKTTLINLITGYIKPDRGRIRFNGEFIERSPPEERVSKGLVRTFQLTSVFNELRVDENIALAVYKSIKLKNKKLHGGIFIKKLLNDGEVATAVDNIVELFELQSMRSKRTSELPHGYKRVLEIAMSYALKPKILFLDEPFSGLSDVEIGKLLTILDSLVRENKLHYLFIVDHKVLWLRRIIQRLMVMFEGKIIGDGDPEDVLKDRMVIESYWGR